MRNVIFGAVFLLASSNFCWAETDNNSLLIISYIKNNSLVELNSYYKKQPFERILKISPFNSIDVVTYAMENANLATVKYLVEQGGDLEPKLENKFILLQVVASLCYFDKYLYLKTKGLNIHHIDTQGMSVIYVAASVGCESIYYDLIQSGVSPDEYGPKNKITARKYFELMSN